MKLPLFIYIFFITISVNAQEENLLQKKQDSIYIDELLSNINRLQSIDSSKQAVFEALKLAQKHKFIGQQGKAHKILGVLYASDYKKLDTSNYHFNTSLLFLRQAGDSLASFDHANNLSINYIHVNDMPKALKYAIDAVDISKKMNLESDLKKKYQGAACLLLGTIYADMKLNDSAVFNLKKSRLYFKDIKSSQQFVASNNIATFYLEQNQYEESKIYLQEALDGYKQHNSLDGIVYTLNSLGDLYFEISDLNKSLKSYQDALTNSAHTNLYRYRLNTYKGLIRVFSKRKASDSAIKYLNKAFDLLDSTEAPKLKVDILKLKADYLQDLGKSEEALSYLKLSMQLEDSIIKKENLPKITTILIEQEKNAGLEEIKDIKKLSSKKNYWILGIVSLLLVLGVLSYFLIKRYRNKLDVSDTTKNRLESSLQLEKENKEYINRKLVSTTANLALKTDLLDQVNELLDQIKNQPKQNLNKEIRETQNQIRIQQHLDSMWREFFTHFEEVHPDFLDSIQSRHGITQNDLKICAFLRMNLSNKDICQLMNVNPNTIRVSIHRIKKKLDVPTGVSVTEFLSVD